MFKGGIFLPDKLIYGQNHYLEFIYSKSIRFKARYHHSGKKRGDVTLLPVQRIILRSVATIGLSLN